MTTATHAVAGVIILPEKVNDRLKEMGKPGFDAIQAQSRLKDVDDVFHY